ncbi:MAG: SufE family protein [Phycisphaeraceae bacterium]
MNEHLQEIVDLFQSVDADMRLELLLDYARKLPPLPQRLRAARDSDEHRVHECQTPVFLWVEADEQERGALAIHVEVAEEAPTVQGFASILVHGYSGQPAQTVAEAPADLLNQLGLSQAIRMTRTIGLSALLARVKREAARVAQAPAG